MEADTTPFCVNINKNRRTRRYRRLNGVVSNKENVKIAPRRKTLQWFRKIELIPKTIRDAYVEMMFCLARHVAKLHNGNNVYILMEDDSRCSRIPRMNAIRMFNQGPVY